jgi:hypothetical protein
VPPCKDGTVRNRADPQRCDPVEKTCPDGQRLNENDQCERVPPPPVKCKQGLTYNTRTKTCEPPKRTETPCKQGTVRNSKGNCVPVQRQPDCPRGTKLNDSGDCEPVQRQPDCPRGTALNDSGDCEPVQRQPDCPRGMKLNDNGDCEPVQRRPECGEGERLNGNGVCEPIQRLVPRGCPDGTYMDRKRKKCLPIPDEQQDEPPPIRQKSDDQSTPDEPAVLRIPGLKLDPGLLQGLRPRNDCKDGMFRDENGRCVPIQ